ncbi:hypothetical protein [Altererythrobacter arenosus]|uniref:hypothetical protein n=1 Tax=Altererythrobacter arenosus TaxID=3032592 RepID=UPI0032422DD2
MLKARTTTFIGAIGLLASPAAAQAVARAQGELGEDASESELIRVALKRAAG